MGRAWELGRTGSSTIFRPNSAPCGPSWLNSWRSLEAWFCGQKRGEVYFPLVYFLSIFRCGSVELTKRGADRPVLESYLEGRQEAKQTGRTCQRPSTSPRFCSPHPPPHLRAERATNEHIAWHTNHAHHTPGVRRDTCMARGRD